MKSDRARFYFSFRSPYSWIGARLAEERIDQEQHPVEYIPYWDPDERTQSMLASARAAFLYTPMPRQKHLYLLQDIKRIASRLGYTLAWPVDRDPWWELPHLGYFVARRHGRERPYLNAVYRARWERGLDICAPAQLAAIAAESGVDPDAVVHAPDEEAIREEGALALQLAWRDGVFGIPFYINGFEKFWGIDRFEDFRASLSRDGRTREPLLRADATASGAAACAAPALVDDTEPYDTGHPGGCG
jgi:2-hydroxychromene-2-carboxylate isomerase